MIDIKVVFRPAYYKYVYILVISIIILNKNMEIHL